DNLRVSSILERVLTGLEAYHEQRKGIFPAELQPSVRRVRQFLAFQQKKMSEAQEAAYAQSPFLNLISRVDIARGDASFYMNVFHPDLTQRRTFSPPSGFNQIEHEIELPRGDLLDPTDSIAKRIRRRVLLRDDIKYL